MNLLELVFKSPTRKRIKRRRVAQREKATKGENKGQLCRSQDHKVGRVHVSLWSITAKEKVKRKAAAKLTENWRGFEGKASNPKIFYVRSCL